MPRPSRPVAPVPAADRRAAGGRRGRRGGSDSAEAVFDDGAPAAGRIPRNRASAHAPSAPGRRRPWRLIRLAVIAAIWGGLAAVLLLLWFARDLPRPADALAPSRRPSLVLRDAAGRVFARLGDVAGTPVRLADLPPFVAQAAVDTEDRRFWTEPGIDPIGILRAAMVDLIHWRIVQGGSTLTQQAAKTLFLSDARTWRRKAQELLLTVWLDHHFSKRQILEIWLNRVYFGSGAWGIDAAARVYFGIPASRLSLWQAAVLDGLPRAPSRFNPRADPDAAAARARQVLAAMVRAGDLTTQGAQAAAAAIAFPRTPPMQAGWFADWVAGAAEPLLAPGQDAGLRTTLDPALQHAAEAALDGVLNGPGVARGASEGAVVVLDAATGAVQALVGGRDYRDSSYDRATEARRPPGSSFKPFVWLAALERGVRPDDRVLDAPIRLGAWHPRDYERRYLGEISVRRALALSINTASVRLLLRAGGPRVVAAVAHRLGITDRLPDNASIALGTANVGLLEMAAAYATFFNSGLRVTPFGLLAVRAGGTLTPVAHPPPVPVIAPALAAMMAGMLRAVVAEGTGAGAAIPGRVVAGKTGTTQDYRDAWFVGAVGGRIIGVWIGNDDDQPMRGVTGGSLPVMVFRRIALTLR
ncbi:MAG: transpeptidase-transglycosylase [Proteobacteria bacterium]|nr:transpeptidase-transglycosylase [Pseudomonadota bacterium]